MDPVCHLQKFYEQRLVIRMAQSSQRVLLLCKGQGLEPRVEFEQQLIEFGPILPHATGDEREVRIRNPCKFALEIYSLENDKVYLEEEKVYSCRSGPPKTTTQPSPFARSN